MKRYGQCGDVVLFKEEEVFYSLCMLVGKKQEWNNALKKGKPPLFKEATK